MNVRTLAALLVLAAAGCTVDNNASVRISNTCAPPAPTKEGCTYSPTCDSVWMSNLWVDTSYVGVPADPRDGTLEWPFEFQNLRDPTSNNDGRTNTATAYITGYKIHYVVLLGPAGTTIPDVRVEDSNRTVEQGGTAVITIPVIPRNIATLLGVGALLATVRAEIRAVGTYADGQDFETGPYSVVVDVVNGRGVYYGCPATTPPAAPLLLSLCPKAGQSAMGTCE
jgi:hypothetical protein